jgi:hypothetical protein
MNAKIIIYSRLLLALLIVSAVSFGQTMADDLFEKPESSAALDIPETPWPIAVLQFLGARFRDHFLEQQFAKDCKALETEIAKAIAGKDAGFLLKVEIYADEYGTPYVPEEGKLVFPIGRGATAFDALAEYKKHQHLQAPPPKGLTDQSSYVWITNKDGHLTARALFVTKREQFEKEAWDESRRRKEVEFGDAARPPDAINATDVAEYWYNVAQQYQSALRDELESSRIATMIRNLRTAQDEFNNAYQKYQEAEAALQQQQQFTRWLTAVAVVTHTVQTAIENGDLVSTHNSGVRLKSEGKPSTAWMEYSKKETDLLTGRSREERLRLELKGADLQTRSREVRETFQKKGITVPEPDIVIPKR